LGARVTAHLLLDDEVVACHELLVFTHDGGDAYARLYYSLGLLEDYVVVCYLKDVELSYELSYINIMRSVVGDTVGKVLLANVKACYHHRFLKGLRDLKSKQNSSLDWLDLSLGEFKERNPSYFVLLHVDLQI
jgi:hypothetical protein